MSPSLLANSGAAAAMYTDYLLNLLMILLQIHLTHLCYKRYHFLPSQYHLRLARLFMGLACSHILGGVSALVVYTGWPELDYVGLVGGDVGEQDKERWYLLFRVVYFLQLVTCQLCLFGVLLVQLERFEGVWVAIKSSTLKWMPIVKGFYVGFLGVVFGCIVVWHGFPLDWRQWQIINKSFAFHNVHAVWFFAVFAGELVVCCGGYLVLVEWVKRECRAVEMRNLNYNADSTNNTTSATSDQREITASSSRKSGTTLGSIQSVFFENRDVSTWTKALIIMDAFQITLILIIHFFANFTFVYFMDIVLAFRFCYLSVSLHFWASFYYLDAPRQVMERYAGGWRHRGRVVARRAAADRAAINGNVAGGVARRAVVMVAPPVSVKTRSSALKSVSEEYWPTRSSPIGDREPPPIVQRGMEWENVSFTSWKPLGAEAHYDVADLDVEVARTVGVITDDNAGNDHVEEVRTRGDTLGRFDFDTAVDRLFATSFHGGSRGTDRV